MVNFPKVFLVILVSLAMFFFTTAFVAVTVYDWLAFKPLFAALCCGGTVLAFLLAGAAAILAVVYDEPEVKKP